MVGFTFWCDWHEASINPTCWAVKNQDEFYGRRETPPHLRGSVKPKQGLRLLKWGLWFVCLFLKKFKKEKPGIHYFPWVAGSPILSVTNFRYCSQSTLS